MVKIGRVVWPGPVGIGAGLVKGTASFLAYGELADAVEVGSITQELRRGNEGQTVWKYADELALRHNAGMPNPGAKNLVMELKDAQYKMKVPWGVNVAVSPGITDTALAVADVQETVKILLEGGLKPDWVTLNVSSPDSDDSLEMLAEPGRVRAICTGLKQLMGGHEDIPLWLKLAPDMRAEEYEVLCGVVVETGVDAVVATNTLRDTRGGKGGWCGEPLRAKSRAVVWQLGKLTGDKVPIVAVGGISRGKHVKDKLEVGASAVQVVSTLLFRGREAAREIRREYEILMADEEERKMGVN